MHNKGLDDLYDLMISLNEKENSFSLNQRCENAGITLEKEVGEEKWKRKVKLRSKYRWFFRFKEAVYLFYLAITK